ERDVGYNARNDEIRDNVTRMRHEWEAQRGALATVRRFNATLSAKGYVWFWPKIAAALTSKHHWLIINCDSCGTVVHLDLGLSRVTLKPQCVLHSAMYNVRAAMETVGRALLRWRSIRLFDPKLSRPALARQIKEPPPEAETGNTGPVPLTRNRTTLLVECSHCTFGNGKPKRNLGAEAHIAASSSTHGRRIQKVGVS